MNSKRTVNITVPKIFRRGERLFVVGYIIILIFGVAFRNQYEFFESVARSLNASLPLSSVALGLMSIFRSPFIFWLFSILVFVSVLVLYVISYGFWLNFNDIRVYRASILDFAGMPIITFSMWVIVETIKFANRRKIE